MYPLQAVARGDRPSAAQMNSLVERINRLTAGAGDIVSPGSEYIPEPPSVFIDVYELTSDPVLAEDSKEYYVTGVLVAQRYCAVDEEGHWVANAYRGGGTVCRARKIGTSDDQLWIVTTPRDSNQEATSDGGYRKYDRVFVTVWGALRVVIGSANSVSSVRFEVAPTDGDGHPLPSDSEDMPAASNFSTGTSFYAYRLKWSSNAEGNVSEELDVVDDVQTVTVNATGGTFTLSYRGAETNALAYNISAANLQTALRARHNDLAYCEVSLASGVYTITNPERETSTLTSDATSLTLDGGPGSIAIAHTTLGYGIIWLADGGGPNQCHLRYKSTTVSGSRGTAVRSGVKWVIVEVQGRAKHCNCTLAQALDSSSAVAYVADLGPTDGGLTPIDTTAVTGTLTSVVDNIGEITLDSNTHIPDGETFVRLVWSDGPDQVHCSALAAVVDGTSLTVDFGFCEPPDTGEELSIEVSASQVLEVDNRYSWSGAEDYVGEIHTNSLDGYQLSQLECHPTA